MSRLHRLGATAALAFALLLLAPSGASAQAVDGAVTSLLGGGEQPPPEQQPAPTPAPAPAPAPAAPPAPAPAPAPKPVAPTRAGPAPAPPAPAPAVEAAPVADPAPIEVGLEGDATEPAAADGPTPAATPAVVTVRQASSSPVVATFLGALAALCVDKGLRRARRTLAARKGEADVACELVTAQSASRRARNLQAAGMFLLAFAGIIGLTAASGGGIRQYGFIAMGYLAVKLVLSSRYKPHAGGDAVVDLSVAAIVPVYNEDPAAFERCLRSLLAQSHQLSEIWVIDDGSSDPQCRRIAKRVLAGVPGARVHTFRENKGKREAQAYAFERSKVEVFCTIDSDTVLDRHAVAEGLKPFADERITAVTGNVRALNHRRNILTKLIDLRYANAFLYERAAYSMLGSVLCACGSLSFWRSDVIKDNLEDFVTQTFLGIPVQYGDDRRLTNYALQRGKVVVQDSSVAFTVVPEKITHFVRQQLRWNKSFFRETLWVLRNFNFRQWVWWLSLAEIVTWATFSTGIVMATLVTPLLTGRLALVYYLSYMAVISYARSVRYLGASESSWSYQLYVFLLSPVYAALHVALLIPLRIVALCTLRQRGWGTRATVEVALTPAGGATVDLTPVAATTGATAPAMAAA